MSDFTLEPMDGAERDALTTDLQAVLEKHNAEMGITSTINLMKRVYPSPVSREDVERGPTDTDHDRPETPHSEF